MKLPFSDEIRDARDWVETTQAAVRINAELTAVEVSLRNYAQLATNPSFKLEQELPGEELLNQAVLSFPSLAAILPLSTDDMSLIKQIRGRIQQIELIRQHLLPLRVEAEAAGEELHSLQHQQIHALEQPEWREAVAELQRIDAQRDKVALALVPLQQTLSQLAPVYTVVRNLRPILHAALVRAITSPDPRGSDAYNLARLARLHTQQLAEALTSTDILLQQTFEPQLPDQAHPRHRTRLLEESQRVLDWMAEIESTVGTAFQGLEEKVTLLQTIYSKLEAALMEKMG